MKKEGFENKSQSFSQCSIELMGRFNFALSPFPKYPQLSNSLVIFHHQSTCAKDVLPL